MLSFFLIILECIIFMIIVLHQSCIKGKNILVIESISVIKIDVLGIVEYHSASL